MFNDLGIKGRVLMLTLLPTSLLALVLGGYFTWLQLSSLQEQLQQRGQMISEQLATLAAPALKSTDRSLLQRVANHGLDQPDVRSISFQGMDRSPLAHAGPNMLGPSPFAGEAILGEVNLEDTTRIMYPVFDFHMSLSGDNNAERKHDQLGWVELEMSRHSTLIAGYRSLLTTLLLTLAGLLVTAMLAFRMSRTINEPLLLIKQRVAQLKEGKLDTRLPLLGSHELDELASGINRMAEALQNAQEEMQHSIDQATEDVRQNLETIEIQNIELDFARKEALEASRIKSEFLANMSHEIRTPLNGILGFTNLLLKSELTPRQYDYLGTIEKSADSLLSIINEILDFSKIEAGKLVLENMPFNLRDLLQETLTILAPTAHEKQLELLSLVYRDAPMSVVGDPLRLKQVLINLVSNAIKFTREGSIVIRAMLEDETQDRAQLRISVQDTGIGLSEEDLRALFQAFSQADNSMSRQAGGSGLGLVISKRLIEQMGGEIGVDSTPGQGSEFWISINLPKARNDIEDLPRPLLQGRRVAMMESRELARQALQHQLEDCALVAEAYATPDLLLDAVASSQHSAEPIGLAVIGASTLELPPEQLDKCIRALEQLSCNSIVLCPTTELAIYQQILESTQTQLQAKPACTRKLQRAMIELISPRQPISEQPTLAPSRAPLVLCVDDNPANLLLVKTLLSDMGANVATAGNGFDAIKLTKQNVYDLILMDVQMPGLDGRQTTEQIRQWEQDHQRQPLPIVALTAHAMSNEKRALLQCGMDDYLTKPVSERQLAQVVLKWTGLGLRQYATEPSPEPVVSIASARVLDNEEGLRLAAGKADLAADMLSMLIAGLPADKQAIRQARKDADRNELLERVHRLHGATRYCGVPQLRAACQRSETFLKQENPEVDSALDALEAAIETLAREVSAVQQ